MKKLGPALVMFVAVSGDAGEVWAKAMKSILRSGFLALAIIMALAVPANAGPYEDGIEAAEQGE